MPGYYEESEGLLNGNNTATTGDCGRVGFYDIIYKWKGKELDSERYSFQLWPNLTIEVFTTGNNN